MFGAVPAMPESRLPVPSARPAPCTTRKSTARGLRHETRWMAMESPIVSIAPIWVTNTKAGRSAQNAGAKSKSNPGQPWEGAPIQGASIHPPGVVEAEERGDDAAGRDSR